MSGFHKLDIAADHQHLGHCGRNTASDGKGDLACPIQTKEATSTNFSLNCALECAKQGSPLIIQSKDGVLYIPISDAMRDKDQRERLVPFVGKYLKVTGKIYERNGTRAIVIAQIAEMKDVHPVTDAH